MSTTGAVSPAFGQADLSNCEKEQIHLAGSIQPHGALIVLDEQRMEVAMASANAESFLGIAGVVAGTRIGDLPGNLAERLNLHLGNELYPVSPALRCAVGENGDGFTATVHRPSDGTIVIEFEAVEEEHHVTEELEDILRRIQVASSLRELCDEVAEIYKETTRFDRVMVYRFDDKGHGEVFSERKQPDLESFLGNRYPASDIPQIARQLYLLNRVRVLSDVDYEPVPIHPSVSPITGEQLDMSLCVLRSMSPIHIQYLKNMGVAGTLVSSLVVDGDLWGLIACHNYSPLRVPYEMRTICALIAESVGTRIAALQGFDQAEALLSVRRLEQHLAESVSREGDWRSALFDTSQSLLKPVDASGAALLYEGQVFTIGDVPSTQEIRRLGAWLDEQPRQDVIATSSLSESHPQFENLTAVASGLLAAPISQGQGEYLIWLRPERIQTVIWGGDPFKPVVMGDSPDDLSPRRSFAKWHQLVEGTSDSWSNKDLTAAKLIATSVSDVIVQFRAVQMLLAEDQLKEVSKHLAISAQPMIVADENQKIIQTNGAFERLIGGRMGECGSVQALAELFEDTHNVRRKLNGLTNFGRKWVGEADIRGENNTRISVVVRADTVFVGDRLLGYVFHFTDLTHSREAEAARRQFQKIISGDRRLARLEFGVSSSMLYRNLLTTIVSNAQLAALEITDDVDVDRIPERLDHIRQSTERSAKLLEHAIWHAQDDRLADGADSSDIAGERAGPRN